MRIPGAVFPFFLSVLLIVVAAAHRWIVSSADYRGHWIIKVEFLLFGLIILCLLIEVLGVVVLFFTGKWLAALVTVGLMVVTLVLFAVALGIDSPTLLYAT